MRSRAVIFAVSLDGTKWGSERPADAANDSDDGDTAEDAVETKINDKWLFAPAKEQVQLLYKSIGTPGGRVPAQRNRYTVVRSKPSQVRQESSDQGCSILWVTQLCATPMRIIFQREEICKRTPIYSGRSDSINPH